MNQTADVLTRLADAIETRLPARGGDPTHSYVARLFAQGPDAFLKKIGEEATELVMAAKDGVDNKIIFEAADLWFHSLIVLAHFGLRPEAVLQELARRQGVSGLTEKARRKAGAEHVKGCSEQVERQADAADRNGMQGANRSHSLYYGEDLQHSRPSEPAEARDAGTCSAHPKETLKEPT